MTLIEQIITIALAAVANFTTRFLPFVLFRTDKTTPFFVRKLGGFLPPAIMAMLVIYCFRNVSWLAGDHGLPDLLASLITIFLHLWRRNLLLSMLGGTLSYIILLNFLF
jgi:branched-subunit amino acid transport protein AzlD